MLNKINSYFYDLRQRREYAGALWLSNNYINSEESHLFLRTPINYMHCENRIILHPWDVGGRGQLNKQRRVVVGILCLLASRCLTQPLRKKAKI